MLSKGAPFGNVACPRFAVYRARITFRGRAGKVVAPDGVRQVYQRLDSGHVPVQGNAASPSATRHARSGWAAHRHATLEIRGLKADIHHGPESQTPPKTEYIGTDHLPFLVFRSQPCGEPY